MSKSSRFLPSFGIPAGGVQNLYLLEKSVQISRPGMYNTPRKWLRKKKKDRKIIVKEPTTPESLFNHQQLTLT